ncbi:DUF5017 domain-containing protein [Chitinophaga sp. MM2321]|uniref:DUF5017 domain-containing protein n=1 Tax=Chitinophaga sp. MM2321 TaxID=3137178 RepID=UPI0032D57253
MRILSFITILAVSAMLASCEKELKPKPISFDVATTGNTYHAGDTVFFTLSGNPDIITFYSGQAGADYTFKDRVPDPDRGVAIKDISQRLDRYFYIYPDPGVYKAVFAAFNAAGTKQVDAAKEINITVQ